MRGQHWNINSSQLAKCLQNQLVLFDHWTGHFNCEKLTNHFIHRVHLPYKIWKMAHQFNYSLKRYSAFIYKFRRFDRPITNKHDVDHHDYYSDKPSNKQQPKMPLWCHSAHIIQTMACLHTAHILLVCQLVRGPTCFKLSTTPKYKQCADLRLANGRTQKRSRAHVTDIYVHKQKSRSRCAETNINHAFWSYSKLNAIHSSFLASMRFRQRLHLHANWFCAEHLGLVYIIATHDFSPFRVQMH